MNLEPPIARWLAAMILAVVAFAAPSAASAHGGHAPAGHRHTVIASVQATLTTVRSVHDAYAPAVRVSVAMSVALRRAAVVLSDDRGRPGGCGEHGICLCGAACCAPGIVAASMALAGPASGHRVLRPRDAPDRAGLGPEALTEPPKPRA